MAWDNPDHHGQVVHSPKHWGSMLDRREPMLDRRALRKQLGDSLDGHSLPEDIRVCCSRAEGSPARRSQREDSLSLRGQVGDSLVRHSQVADSCTQAEACHMTEEDSLVEDSPVEDNHHSHNHIHMAWVEVPPMDYESEALEPGYGLFVESVDEILRFVDVRCPRALLSPLSPSSSLPLPGLAWTSSFASLHLYCRDGRSHNQIHFCKHS